MPAAAPERDGASAGADRTRDGGAAVSAADTLDARRDVVDTRLLGVQGRLLQGRLLQGPGAAALGPMAAAQGSRGGCTRGGCFRGQGRLLWVQGAAARGSRGGCTRGGIAGAGQRAGPTGAATGDGGAARRPGGAATAAGRGRVGGRRKQREGCKATRGAGEGSAGAAGRCVGLTGQRAGYAPLVVIDFLLRRQLVQKTLLPINAVVMVGARLVFPHRRLLQVLSAAAIPPISYILESASVVTEMASQQEVAEEQVSREASLRRNQE
ncbi:unnamed protein product [Closterium sp. NIES-54]